MAIPGIPGRVSEVGPERAQAHTHHVETTKRARIHAVLHGHHHLHLVEILASLKVHVLLETIHVLPLLLWVAFFPLFLAHALLVVALSAASMSLSLLVVTIRLGYSDG